MKKNIFIIIALAILMMFTSCEPSVGYAEKSPNHNYEDGLLGTNQYSPSKSLTVKIENLSVDHYEYNFEFLGDRKGKSLAFGETDGWVSIKETPNDWDFYLEQGLWRFEAKAFFVDNTSISFDPYEGYVNKTQNALSEYADYILSTFDENGTGSVKFDSLMLPALYADKTNFYVGYELLDEDFSIVRSGTVPMAEVKSGDGVATLNTFSETGIDAGEYFIRILVYEMNEKTGQYDVKSCVIADGIKIFSGCNSIVTGTFGDDGNYLNATIRTFQTATTFTGKVSSEKLGVGGNNTYDDFTFTCLADNPTNIRWFVDGVEQTKITITEKQEIMETHYFYKCPDCGGTVTSGTNAINSYGYTRCPICNEWITYSGLNNTRWTEDRGTGRYKDVEVTKDADGTETEFTVQLSQMGHGYSGATTHYVECIYTDVEGHTSSSTQEMFVGSNYFPNLGASSIFVMGNGNEIDHWKINLTPDSSLSTNGFHTYSSAEGDIEIDADKGIWISEGLWVVNSATAYDSEGMALLETTTPKKTYINKMNPYINIESVIKSETTETGTIRIRDLKMNSLTWDCNYATGTIDPLKVKTYVTVYKLTDEGKDDDSFEPLNLTIDGCTLLETGKTVRGTSGGKSYSYHNDTYQIVGAETEKDFEVPEGTYRVQIKINSGARNNAKPSYNGNKSYYAGQTEGDLEVIVNVQAHTTQVVTGTLSCNHCLKTDGTI